MLCGSRYCHRTRWRNALWFEVFRQGFRRDACDCMGAANDRARLSQRSKPEGPVGAALSALVEKNLRAILAGHDQVDVAVAVDIDRPDL